jgi:hypothetical protein
MTLSPLEGDIDLLTSHKFLGLGSVVLLLKQFVRHLPDRIESTLLPKISSKINALMVVRERKHATKMHLAWG